MKTSLVPPTEIIGYKYPISNLIMVVLKLSSVFETRICINKRGNNTTSTVFNVEYLTYGLLYINNNNM